MFMAWRFRVSHHLRLSLVCFTTALAITLSAVSAANASSQAAAPAAHGKTPAPAAPSHGQAPAADARGKAAAPATPAAPKPSAAPVNAAAKPAQTPETQPAPAAEGSAPLNADQIVTMMKEGNNHFRAGRLETPNTSALRRFRTASDGQKPVATIISCADSRVPVELIFDRGIGELFVIRVAGNVCDTDEIGSAEYGVDHLGTPVLIVMGHTKCGAVTAVVSGAALHGSIAPLVENIKPAVAAARHDHPQHVGDDLLNDAVKANVLQSIEDILTKSDMIRERAKSGKVRVEGAIYDLEAGTIEWIGPHPKQQALLESAASPTDAHASNAPAKPDADMHAAEPTHPGEAPAAPTHAAPKSEAKPNPSAESATGTASVQPGMTAALAAAVPAEQPRRPVASRMEALPSLLERCMAEEQYQQGIRALEAGDYALAAEKLRSAGQLDPSMLAARSDLAGVLYLQQKYADALEIYKSVLTADAHDVNAIRGAALCHASLKEYDSARSMLRKLLDLNRRDAQAWLDLGDVSFLAGDAPAAREDWETASRLTSASPEMVKQANLRLNVYAVPSPAPVARN